MSIELGQSDALKSSTFPTGIYIKRGSRGEEIPISTKNFKFYEYDSSVPQRIKEIKDIAESSNLDKFNIFQYLIRTLDMIKDGKPGKTPVIDQKEIWDVMDPLMTARIGKEKMNKFSSRPPFDDLHVIVKSIQDKNKHQITERTWLRANAAEMKNNGLPYNYYYKESGIDPLAIIDDSSSAVSNIVTEFIDPLHRAYGKGKIVWFTDSHEEPNATIKITEKFLDFFGFFNCSLEDKRVSNGPKEQNHDYKLKISPDITITPQDNKCAATGESWYKGNIAKNNYFAHPKKAGSHDINTWKKALLNVKELGDVLQVLIMFLIVASEKKNGEHIMVTCDRIVFILCIQLGLNCILYTHPASGTHSIQHFKSEYTYDQAVKDFNSTKEKIIKHNKAMIAGITALRDNKLYKIELSQMNIPNFRFCDAFLNAIIADMENIQNAIINLTPLKIQGSGNEAKQIATIKQHMTDLDKTYKLKQLFTFKKSYNVPFSTTVNKYTEEQPFPILTYTLIGYQPERGAISFFAIYKNHYASKMTGCIPIRGGVRNEPRLNVKRATLRNKIASAKAARNTQKRLERQYIRNQYISQYRSVLKKRSEEEVMKYFELSFPEVEYIEGVEFDIETGKMNPNYNQVVDIHAQWAQQVRNYLDVKKYPSTPLLYYHEYDIWWNLYDYCNNYHTVIYGADLERQIDNICLTIEKLHDNSNLASDPYYIKPQIVSNMGSPMRASSSTMGSPTSHPYSPLVNTPTRSPIKKDKLHNREPPVINLSPFTFKKTLQQLNTSQRSKLLQQISRARHSKKNSPRKNLGSVFNSYQDSSMEMQSAGRRKTRRKRH